jgi:DNA-binding HxlR family transcriptional regulator
VIYHVKTRFLLDKLSKLYEDCSTSDTTLAIVYSKMAILEVCGWLEESFDEIAHNCVRRRLRTLESRKFLFEKIKSTHGFQYDLNIRPLISHAIGVVRLLQIEREIEDSGSLTVLKTTCSNLNIHRRDAAHRTLAGRQQQYPAPSVAIREFETCLPIVLQMWSLVR